MEQNDALISVIVPVYNAERYLDRCIESIASQTYRNLEILLIDDASTDSAGRICDEWAKRDARIRVIHNETSHGCASFSRNLGLSIAAGEYIGLIDNDDFISPDMYGKLLAAIREDGSDICICGVVNIDAQGNELEGYPPPFKREVLGRRELYERIEFNSGDWRYITVWNRLYAKKVFQNVRFQDNTICEDDRIVPELFENCEKFSLIPDPMYRHTRRNDSLGESPITLARLDRMYTFWERYWFYLRNYDRRLAKSALERSYNYLRIVFKNVNAWENRRILTPWFLKIAVQQCRMRNFHPRTQFRQYLRALRKGRRERAHSQRTP